jgi:hypothetical protein
VRYCRLWLFGDAAQPMCPFQGSRERYLARPTIAAALQRRHQRKVSTAEGVAMAGKSPRKSNAKKQGKTLKEKQAAKKLEKARRRDTSHIPPTGH